MHQKPDEPILTRMARVFRSSLKEEDRPKTHEVSQTESFRSVTYRNAVSEAFMGKRAKEWIDVLHNEEAAAILALRPIMDLGYPSPTEKPTDVEVEQLRMILGQYRKEAEEDADRGMDPRASRIARPSRAAVRTGDTPVHATADTAPDKLAPEPTSADPPHPLPETQEPQSAPRHGPRVLALAFDDEEIEALSRWTRLGDEALRGFVRTALGNHIFIEQQCEAGRQFLLEEPSPAPGLGPLRRVRFR